MEPAFDCCISESSVGYYETKTSQLTYTAEVNWKSWLERDLNSHLRDTGPPLCLLSYNQYADNLIWVQCYPFRAKTLQNWKRTGKCKIKQGNEVDRFSALSIACVFVEVVKPKLVEQFFAVLTPQTHINPIKISENQKFCILSWQW